MREGVNFDRPVSWMIERSWKARKLSWARWGLHWDTQGTGMGQNYIDEKVNKTSVRFP